MSGRCGPSWSFSMGPRSSVRPCVVRARALAGGEPVRVDDGDLTGLGWPVDAGEDFEMRYGFPPSEK